jgi:hypothetical protein
VRGAGSDVGVRWAFAACALVVLAALLALSWPSDPEVGPARRARAPASEAGPSRADQAARAVIYESQNPSASTREPHQATARHRSEADGTRVARAFLRAYLPYEVGKGSTADRRRVVRLAGPELGIQLAEGEPRVPPGIEMPAEARLVALEGIYGPRQQRSMTAAATLERAGERSTLFIKLLRREGEWRVEELGR